MNITAFATLFLLFSTGVQGARPTDTEHPLTIRVKCKGIDLSTLDEMSSIVFGQILEETFNTSAVSDGSSLVVSDRVGWGCGALCPYTDDPKKRGKPPRQLRTLSSSDVSAKFEAMWICNDLCPDDDEGSDTSNNKKGDSTVSAFVSRVVDIKEWEEELIYSLIDSRRKDFRAIEYCEITFMEMNDEAAE